MWDTVSIEAVVAQWLKRMTVLMTIKFGAMKYLKILFLCSGKVTKREFEFQQSTHMPQEFGGKWRTEVELKNPIQRSSQIKKIKIYCSPLINMFRVI